ncbi:RAxF-45 family protein [Heyndrickxia vini]|nr:RAxF-45 family protein [Heyndrickxia vini]
MSNTVFVRGQLMDYMYICRAIFHTQAANGISLPIFSNFILKKR